MSKKKKSNRSVYLMVLLIVIAGLAVYFLQRSGNEPEISTQSEAIDIPFRKQGELFFTSRQNGDTLAMIDIEVADNDQLRARGLMYRRSLPENAGMLFIQSMEEMQSFWMKNTYIPLDILFVNRDKEIVTIHANTTPLKEWNYASTKPAIYVVEVNAGFTNRHGIRTGDRIEFIIPE
ncbi:DUF192 domain-containing protein [Proteiniphilum sp. X52]|uniref:DUF192 domain-containing protein n=1 Tax=Proteiniphilum sp. X52 TaxID=2382159 RepID=UPI000F0A61D7|nr:DUF192 domain-containing protein [Proteiniphilum sp. X52]RNC65491.1 DUF192 domain-containing protein [Proteiniphilum sp. X52]